MKLSTRARYGLRLCFLLSLSPGETVPLSRLTRQSGLSEKYSEQLLGLLRRGGVVQATRGASGGYALSAAPECISIRTVLEALDDGFSISDCASGGACSDAYCPNRQMLGKLYRRINTMLEQMTLADMLEENTCKPIKAGAARSAHAERAEEES